jgi:hypothetical protein
MMPRDEKSDWDFSGALSTLIERDRTDTSLKTVVVSKA